MTVSVQSISKKFGNVSAIDEVSFEVKDGEFMVLLGPSGSGKTTTLRCVAGLETVDSGKIIIDDSDVTDLPPGKRDVAMVFQNYALYPYMTVFENIAFPLRVKKVPKDEITARVREVAEFLKISHLLDRKPKQLSGGEQQRVALGRAIIRKPKVFLMDEPLSNLDAKLRIYMRAELKKLQRELKAKMVYVTHDQAEAMTMADRIAVFNSGKIQQIDSPIELYSRPENTFVAGFIGAPAMNLIPVSIIQKDSSFVAETSVFRYQLSDRLLSRLRESGLLDKGKAILGVRPEDIVLAQPGIRNTSRVQVFMVEPLGSETIVDISTEDTLLKMKLDKGMNISAGDFINITFREEGVHFFDPSTGKNIT
ncbi:MAG: ABC transporter ATP-binding protein [Conexivisphaerales archaeon]